MSLEHRLHERCACGSALSSGTSHALSHAQSARPFPLAGTTRVYERPRPFVIRHIALDLTLDRKKKGIAGTARIDVARVDSSAKELVLDAVGFEISAVDLRAGDPPSSDAGGKNAKAAAKPS